MESQEAPENGMERGLAAETCHDLLQSLLAWKLWVECGHRNCSDVLCTNVSPCVRSGSVLYMLSQDRMWIVTCISHKPS
jgi:hypothetical protein